MLHKITAEIKRLMLAFSYSFSGLRAALSEAAFRLELMVSAFAIPLALFLGKSGVERALLIGSIMLVMIVELLNTGIEAAIDRISEERHPISKLAKDVASAAVLLSIINAFIVWALVLWS